MEDCNATLCSMEPRLKLSKAEGEPEVETTQYRKVVGCLRFLLHTRLDLMYSVGMVSRYMQSPRESHARAIKQILRYLKGTNGVGRESDKKVNPHSSLVMGYKTNRDSKEDKYRSDNTSISIARLETIQVLIALAAGKGWKIHHLDVKTAFLNIDRMKLDSIEVSRGKDCIEIKQERYAMKILKEAGMEDCNATLCPMEPRLKLSKAEDEPKVETTQYRKMKTIMALSLCEAEFMAATAAACHAIWLRELLVEVT
nr:uncharacterized mitochondrial protein AtMg00810-like [Tanacetum cinerariifolium]